MSPRTPQAPSPPAPELCGEPRSAARALRGLLARKVAELLRGGELDRQAADELAKIGRSLAELERCGYDLRLASLEVLERFGRFVQSREPDPSRREWLAGQVAEFFRHLEGEV